MNRARAAWLSALLERNYRRLRRELHETGELYHLLARVARRQPLSDEERRRMRTQLIDVAKVIPALAILAAPGGLLLLVALGKVLPFNLLPSAFQDEPPVPPPPPAPEPVKDASARSDAG